LLTTICHAEQEAGKTSTGGGRYPLRSDLAFVATSGFNLSPTSRFPIPMGDAS
jgi:hypothetical protein